MAGKSSLNSVSRFSPFSYSSSSSVYIPCVCVCVVQSSSILAKMVMKNSENQEKRKKHHHFFKIVHPDQLNTQHLRIPSKFMKHISSKSYDQGIILEGPSGKQWHAKLCRTRDGTYIREGWQKFVTEHSLWDNELLVFKYDGNMCFSIQIFDNNGCERENVHTSSETHHGPIVEKRKPGRPPKKKVVSYSSQKQDTPETISASLSGNERDEPAVMKLVRRPGKEPGKSPKKNDSLEEPSPSTASKGNLGQKIKSEDEDDSLPICQMDTKATHCLSREQTQTEEEAKLLKAVESFSSSHPYFISHLRTRTLWKSYLYIPAGFAKAHFPPHSMNMILRNPKGKAWTVKLVCYTNTRNMYNFCGGWPAFVHANDLEEGDICIFELVGKLEFCVHIFRLVKEDAISV